MTRFVTVKRNGKNQAVPVNRKRYSVSRKVTAKDLLKWQPQKIGKLVRLAGFENTDYEPFEFTGPPKEFSVNGMRLSNIDQIYLGEEAVSFYSSGNEAATVFYSDMKSFNPGGKARIGGNSK